MKVVQYHLRASYKYCHIVPHTAGIVSCTTGMIKIYLVEHISFEKKKYTCSPEVWYWLTVWLSLQGVIGVSGAWRMQVLNGLCGWCSAHIYCRLCQPSWAVFFQLASLPPPCPLSLFPLLVGVMGECRGTSVGAHSWVSRVNANYGSFTCSRGLLAGLFQVESLRHSRHPTFISLWNLFISVQTIKWMVKINGKDNEE